MRDLFQETLIIGLFSRETAAIPFNSYGQTPKVQ